MSRNYTAPTVAYDWYNSRETHVAVATAIHCQIRRAGTRDGHALAYQQFAAGEGNRASD